MVFPSIEDRDQRRVAEGCRKTRVSQSALCTNSSGAEDTGGICTVAKPQKLTPWEWERQKGVHHDLSIGFDRRHDQVCSIFRTRSLAVQFPNPDPSGRSSSRVQRERNAESA